MTLLFPTVTIHQSQTLEIFYKALNSQSSFFKEKKLLFVGATQHSHLQYQQKLTASEQKASQQFQKNLQRTGISCLKTRVRQQEIRESNSKD